LALSGSSTIKLRFSFYKSFLLQPNALPEERTPKLEDALAGPEAERPFPERRASADVCT